MKQITDVRKIKRNSSIDNRCIVGELDDISLTIGVNGEEQSVPILGLFKVDDKYYVTLLVKEDSKEVVVIYEVVKNDEAEHIQVIETKEEWDKVNKAWSDILDVVDTKL